MVLNQPCLSFSPQLQDPELIAVLLIHSLPIRIQHSTKQIAQKDKIIAQIG